MEFWGCDSEGFEYDLFSEDEELGLAVEGLDKSRNMLVEFDLESPFGLEEDVSLMDERVMERFQEVESSLSEVIGKPPESNRSVENLWVGDGIFSGDDINVASPDCGLSSFSLLREYDESWSGNSSCGLELNSSVLNLEMGRQEGESEEISKTRSDALVGDTSLLDQQVNSESLSSTKVTCQVQGCDADLTSSKDYYKRHRVCPVDTKKAEVIVNGIQKRFCQQCSRFHLLNEFDDDKRSCRKRLAGHNKRRRKPRFEGRLNRPHKFQPYIYEGTRLHGTGQPPRRHISANSLPASVLFPDIYEQINGLKPQSTAVYGPPSTTTFRSSGSYLPGAEYYAPPEAPSTVRNPSEVFNALSLLSNQPHASFPYFSTSPVIIPGHNIFHRTAPNFSFPSPQMFQANQLGQWMLPGTVNPFGYVVSGFQNAGSLCSNCSDGHVPPQHGSTVNLRQLSFNLSRVEHQRHVP